MNLGVNPQNGKISDNGLRNVQKVEEKMAVKADHEYFLGDCHPFSPQKTTDEMEFYFSLACDQDFICDPCL